MLGSVAPGEQDEQSSVSCGSEGSSRSPRGKGSTRSRVVKKLSRALDTPKNGLSSDCRPCISAEQTCMSTSAIFSRSFPPERLQTPNPRSSPAQLSILVTSNDSLGFGHPETPMNFIHAERNHQGLDNELIEPLDRPPDTNTEIETTERLGGLLRSYRRAA